MNPTCKNCGSFAINHYKHGRDGSDVDLCDVCFWRKRANAEAVNRVAKLEAILITIRNMSQRTCMTFEDQSFAVTELATAALRKEAK